jgi:DNA end-binding protein Ku
LPRRSTAVARSEHPRGRPIWSGSISFGLVTIPVELVSAERRARPALRMLGPEGRALRREFFCPKDGKALEDDEIERGYEVADGKFVLVTDEELQALAPRSSRDIDLTQFVDRASLDPRYFVRSYFVLPGEKQTKAYALLAETMGKTGRAALAKFVMRGKGYAVAIFAEEGVLRAQTLRFHEELRQPDELDLGKPAKVEPLRARRMQAVIKSLSANAIPEKELADPDTERLLEVTAEKRKKGEDLVKVRASKAEPEETPDRNVIDLVQALRQRLAAKRSSEHSSAKRRAVKSPAKKRKAATRGRSTGGARRRPAAKRSTHG